MSVFDNSYARLPERFFTRMPPQPVAAPSVIRVNGPLARQLGFDPASLAGADGLAWLAGNSLPEGAEPLAQAYAGHQFGGWSPQLGDGRAILLGEVIGADGARRDIQLKGSGRTPYSRMGDGRAALGPVIREYVVSEAMAALGVPTTRALAAVRSGERVLREDGPLPGAVLARVAASHIRVGTFQFFAARQDMDALRLLTGHALARHYPDASGEDPALTLLEAVIASQAALVARWMGLGFIHGVMNTDNMSIAGETIDYGPCAFIDAYHPDTVFSSIDTGGRYAYRNQPLAANWNLAQLASALLPIIGDGDREAAIVPAQAAVDRFMDLYEAAWRQVFRAKLGLREAREGDAALIGGLLEAMADGGLDFTQTFRGLGEGTVPEGLSDWAASWRARLDAEGATPETRAEAMNRVNPAIIPRNHRVAEAISAAEAGDDAPFHALTEALETPFDAAPDSPYRAAPLPEEKVLRTFCGT